MTAWSIGNPLEPQYIIITLLLLLLSLIEGLYYQAMGRLESCYAFHLYHLTRFDLQIPYQSSRI